MRQQVEREGVLPDLDVRQLRGPLDHGPHDFLAGGVAQGVDDAVVAVPAFAAQRQRRPPADRTACPTRSARRSARGASRTTISTTSRIAQRAAGRERVGDVILEAVLGIEHAGDAPLGVVAVRLPQAAPW